MSTIRPSWARRVAFAERIPPIAALVLKGTVVLIAIYFAAAIGSAFLPAHIAAQLIPIRGAR